VKLHTIARRLSEEVWAVFESVLPPATWSGEGRPPASNHKCLRGLLCAPITGVGRGHVPPGFPRGRTLKERLKLWLGRDSFRPALRATARHLPGQGPPRRRQEAGKRGGAGTRPSPGDRPKCGSTTHLATGERGPPAGAVATRAGANGGAQTQAALQAVAVQPPAPQKPGSSPDPRGRPRARADGAYGNRPAAARSAAAGFRVEAPKGGQTRRAGPGGFAVPRGAGMRCCRNRGGSPGAWVAAHDVTLAGSSWPLAPSSSVLTPVVFSVNSNRLLLRQAV
jgi:hypothetical protein